MTLDYNELKKQFLSKQKKLDKIKTARNLVAAINKNKRESISTQKQRD